MLREWFDHTHCCSQTFSSFMRFFEAALTQKLLTAYDRTMIPSAAAAHTIRRILVIPGSFSIGSRTVETTCLEPLKKEAYIFGTVMPLVLLGILPMIAGIAVNNSNILILGIILADSAAGDIMIIWKLLRYKSDSGEVVYMDHPTEAGGVVFER